MDLNVGGSSPLGHPVSLERMPETNGFALDCKSICAIFFLRLHGAGWLPVGNNNQMVDDGTVALFFLIRKMR